MNTFLDNNPQIRADVSRVLGCAPEDISAFEPLGEGLTNSSFLFAVGGESYVYRHPGEGTDAIINRESEAFSQGIARDLGLDGTFIYEDQQKGWKLSRYLEGCHTLDYHDWDEVSCAIDMARRLHNHPVVSPWEFDIYAETLKILDLLDADAAAGFSDFEALCRLAAQLDAIAKQDGSQKCLCHNDFYEPNFLIADGRMHLIDWEYSAMGNYANDLGVFICCSDYGLEEAQRVFELYFQRPPSDAERRHCLASVGLASFYWFVWALYKEACGDPVGHWLQLWHDNTGAFGREALEIGESAA